MDEATNYNQGPQPAGTAINLSPNELGVLLTAVGLLEATLGHEEADELEQVQALKLRLEALRGG